MNWTARIVLIAWLLPLAATTGFTQDRIAELNVPTIVTNLLLGYSVDIRDNHAILGGPGEVGGQWGAGGEAYIFFLTNDEWVAQAHLVPSDSGVRDRFGSAVAIQDPYAAVVANASNKTYIFHRSGTNWTETQIIVPTGGCESVAFSGTRMVIGSPDEDSVANQSGAAYVYDLVGGTWVQQARLKADVPYISGDFGYQVAIDGTRILVGDWTYPNTNGITGAAFLFEPDGPDWDLVHTFVCTNEDFFGNYGYDVDILGDQALIAAYDSAGDAWVSFQEYSGGVWTETARLDDPLTTGFGRGVALGERWMAGGAVGPPATAAMVYEDTDDGPVRQIRYTALRTASTEYGYFTGPHFPMALDGHRIIIGHHDSSHAGSWTNNGALIYSVNTNNRQYRVDGTNQFVHSGLDEGAMGAVAVEDGLLAVAFMPAWDTSAVVQVFAETNQHWPVQDTIIRPAPGDPKEFMAFGSVLDMDGDSLAIGCPNVSTGPFDSVYVYVQEATNWVEQYVTTYLTNSEFGVSLAIAGDLLAIGVPGYENPTFDEGAIWIHARSGTNWTYQTGLLPDDATLGDGFGLTVDMTTNRLISGSFYADALNGKAWIYRNDGGGTWVQEALLQAPVPSWEDHYGKAVAISENYAAVGAPENTNGETYVYMRTGTNWNLIARFTAPEPREDDRFGCSVALNDDFLLVGADDKGALVDRRPGRTYLYQLDGTNVTLAVNTWPGDPSDEYEFGRRVALSEHYGAVGVGTSAEGYVLYLPDLVRDLFPVISDVSMAGTLIQLQITELTPGVTYEVRKTGSMDPVDWQAVDTFLADTNWNDWSETSTPTTGFYRVQEQ